MPFRVSRCVATAGFATPIRAADFQEISNERGIVHNNAESSAQPRGAAVHPVEQQAQSMVQG